MRFQNEWKNPPPNKKLHIGHNDITIYCASRNDGCEKEFLVEEGKPLQPQPCWNGVVAVFDVANRKMRMSYLFEHFLVFVAQNE